MDLNWPHTVVSEPSQIVYVSEEKKKLSNKWSVWCFWEKQTHAGAKTRSTLNGQWQPSHSNGNGIEELKTGPLKNIKHVLILSNCAMQVCQCGFVLLDGRAWIIGTDWNRPWANSTNNLFWFVMISSLKLYFLSFLVKVNYFSTHTDTDKTFSWCQFVQCDVTFSNAFIVIKGYYRPKFATVLVYFFVLVFPVYLFWAGNVSNRGADFLYICKKKKKYILCIIKTWQTSWMMKKNKTDS